MADELLNIYDLSPSQTLDVSHLTTAHERLTWLPLDSQKKIATSVLYVAGVAGENQLPPSKPKLGVYAISHDNF